MAPSVPLLGVGMGTSLASLYDVAVGDVAAEETSSAGGALSAVHAMSSSLLVVGGTTLVRLVLVRLLPPSARTDPHGA